MFTVTVWVCWTIFMAIGLITGLIATAPGRWQDRLVFVGASVAAFIVALIWSAHFSL